MEKIKVIVAHQGLGRENLRRIAAVDPRVEVTEAIYVDETTREWVDSMRQLLNPNAPPADGSLFFEMAPEAEVILTVRLPANILQIAPKLKWVHVYGAGVDPMAKTGILEHGVKLTNSAGINAPPIAEFVMAYMLMHVKHMANRVRAQDRGEWQRWWNDSLDGKVLGIVGPGHIGGETAKRAAPFGMRVIAARRSYMPGEKLPHIEEVYPMSRLHEMLAQCDYVLISVSLSQQTRRLIGEEELAAIKKGAYLMNVARGAVIDQKALITALHSGNLGGAALDVFDPEPLEKDSPLWKMPNVLITPHNAGGYIRHPEKATAFFCENLRRYIHGEPLLNHITPEMGY
jgi:phosphoglycerate dehydrogenase-like enzyme